jgi:hypothetical protein
VALGDDAAEWTSDMDKLHPSPDSVAAFATNAAIFKATIGLVDESEEPAPKAFDYNNRFKLPI